MPLPLGRILAATIVRRRHLGRWLAAVIILLVVCLLAASAITNPRFGWSVVGEYFFSAPILAGLGLTLELTAIASLIALIVGTILALMRMSSNPVLRLSSAVYIWFFRSVPLLVQIIFFYNFSALYPHISFPLPFASGLPTNVNAIVTPFVAALLGLTFNESAYTAETVRGGILSVSKGQWEAAKGIGFRYAQTIRLIVLPQAMKVFLPPFGNQVVSLLKATSLVSIVALADLLYSAELIYSRTFQTIPLLIVASLWYLIVVSILSFGQSVLEARLSSEVAGSTSRGILARFYGPFIPAGRPKEGKGD